MKFWEIFSTEFQRNSVRGILSKYYSTGISFDWIMDSLPETDIPYWRPIEDGHVWRETHQGLTFPSERPSQPQHSLSETLMSDMSRIIHLEFRLGFPTKLNVHLRDITCCYPEENFLSHYLAELCVIREIQILQNFK